jgi:ketosteroid isomerase-like protein
MAAVRELYDTDVVARLPEGWPEPGPFVGRGAVMRQIEQMRETWDADALEPIGDFIDAADRVVVRFTWRGAGHGPEANVETTGVYTVRKGRIFYQEHFWDHAEALETLGLSELAKPQGGVEVVRACFEAFNLDGAEAAAAFLDPKAEWHDIPAQPDAGVHYGREGFVEAMEQFFGELEDYSTHLDETIDHDEQVIACFRVVGQGKGSGARFEQRAAGVWTFRNGLVVRVVNFGTREEAFKAAGLSE